jgi:hypothetical protein
MVDGERDALQGDDCAPPRRPEHVTEAVDDDLRLHEHASPFFALVLALAASDFDR